MLTTKVILLNVTNLSDARYAAGMGVDYIGFSINPVSNNYVTAEDANAISGWLSGVSLIGNLGNSPASYDQYKVDYLLTTDQALVTSLDEPIYSVNLTVANKDDMGPTLEALANKVSFFILNVDKDEVAALAGTISKFNANYKCFVSTEFDENNLKIVLGSNPKGIVLHGSHEAKPGLSNYDGIADVLELLDEV